jgi:hypothetical protein
MNHYLSLLALASAVLAQNCPLQFDGRVPAGSTPASFDATTSPFGTKFVFGQSELPICLDLDALLNLNRLDLEQDHSATQCPRFSI